MVERFYSIIMAIVADARHHADEDDKTVSLAISPPQLNNTLIIGDSML
jgi:hypothetical protein